MAAIRDTQFATAVDPLGEWTVRCHDRVTMVFENDGSTLRLRVAKASGANWHAELEYAPIRVAAGEVFDLAFCARADHPFKFSVWLGQQDPPHASLVTEANHFGSQEMTSSWKRFSHRWVACRTEEKARLNFVLGQMDNTIEVKDVQLRRVPPAERTHLDLACHPERSA